MTTITSIIKTEAAACEILARAQGAEGRFDVTAADCDSIVEAVEDAHGRKPTKAEWADAGFRFVGSRHYEG